MKDNYKIDPDISKAETLPSSFYKDPVAFELIKEKIFLKSWQWVGDENLVEKNNYVYPLVILEKYLSETPKKINNIPFQGKITDFDDSIFRKYDIIFFSGKFTV